MISFQLWRSISDAAIDDPIFRRVSQLQRSARASKRRRRLPRILILLAGLALVAAVLHSPGLLVLVLLVPMLLIALMVASPILLPLYVWAAGAQLTAEVIGGICREKRQHTYDLICALTQGRLSASWSFAAGMAHRCDWFAPLRWGTLATLRAGLALLGGLSVFALLAAISSPGAFGFEQVRLLLLVALGLALYYSNMTQIMVQSLVIGLLASSFEWSKPDATVVGLFLYVVLGAAPLLAAGLILSAFGRLVVEPAPLLRLAAESGALLLVMALRELLIALLWRALAWRLEWGRAREPRHLEASLAQGGLAAIE